MKTIIRLASEKSVVLKEGLCRGFARISPLVAALALSSCLSPADTNLTASEAPSTLPPPGGGTPAPGTGTGTGSTSPNAGNRAAYFKIESAWMDDESTKETLAECEILRGSAPVGTTCSARVPEGQLYHSRLSFTWGTDDTATCRVMNFIPYHYQVSNTAGFIPTYKGGTTTIDCSASPINADCFNGVGKSIVPNFPNNVGFFFLTNAQTSMTKTTSSAEEEKIFTNRYTVNDLADQITDIPGHFVGGSMHNYTVECRDEWNDLQYEIVFTLSDEDSNGSGSTPGGPPTGETPGSGPTNHYSDWN